MQKFEEKRHFELPQGYGDNRIVIMVRDPYWIYTYWEVNQKRINEIRTEFGPKFDGAKMILRVYDAQHWNFFTSRYPAWSGTGISMSGGPILLTASMSVS